MDNRVLFIRRPITYYYKILCNKSFTGKNKYLQPKLQVEIIFFMKVKIIMSLSMHSTKKRLTQKKELVALLVYYLFKRASTEVIRKISVPFSRGESIC